MANEQHGGGAFGTYVRAQRRLARLSLRQLSDLTQISNPYLSQIERGLHQPSVTVIKNLARAFGVSVEALLAQAAGVAERGAPASTEAAIAADSRLNDGQREALLTVYRSMVGAPPSEATPEPAKKAPAARKSPAKKAPAARKSPAKKAPAARKSPAKKAGAAKRQAGARKTARKASPDA